jgi:ADP-heptose:LPS heptosyltransferase
MIHTPVLFIIFNRPDVTSLVFNEIKKAQPKQLFVAADGPRANRPADIELCRETRAIIDLVDWPCEVKTLFREHNLGCGDAVSSAITWFFEQVEEGIILEDDCLPHPTFFSYCQDLLEYYRNNPKVMHIGGVNFQNDHKRGDASYYFSGITHVWGWASWRRAWQLYNFNVSDFYTFVRDEKIYDYFPNEKLALHWLQNFKSMYYHQIDTWDHQWSYAVLNNGGLSIVPNTNLISNIGFREDATHTSSSNSVYANAKTSAIQFPLKHPLKVELNQEADYYFFQDVEKLPIAENNSIYSLRMKLRSFLSRSLEYVLRNYVFTSKFKNPKKNVLIQKVDAVGDYIITRNFFKEIIQSEKYKGYNIYLLANIRLKTFIDETDKHFFKDVIYFDPNDLSKLKSKYGFYLKLRRLKLDTIINSTYSRSVITDDIVLFSGAKNTIGFKGDTSNITIENKTVTDTYYNELIDVDSLSNVLRTHEFEKQKLFYSVLLNNLIHITKPSIDLPFVKVEQNKICICPGAQEERRIWNSENFGKLINLIGESFSEVKIIVICAPNEEYLGAEIMKFCEKSNLVEQVNVKSIYGLCTLLNESSLVIGNDSAPMHIAVALNKKAICISNGNHYNRFVPYPLSIYKNLDILLPEAFNEENLASENFLNYYYSHHSYLNINEIKPEDVFNVCKKYLKRS